MTAADDELTVRPATTADDDAVLTLLQSSLGWLPDEDHASFFRWKHRENPFGTSPAWVATVGERVVGYRTFLRWEFRLGERLLRAVRAVDTATHPDFQGRGIFSKLTLRAVDDMREDGVDFVFNTPNDKSRPGYLKMGWVPIGRPLVLAHPRLSVGALRRMATARAPSEKWWTGPSPAPSALEVLDDDGAVRSLLAAAPPASGAATVRSVEFLRWRYGFGPLDYRALLAGRGAADGFVVYRLHRRGDAVEASICDALLPSGSGRSLGALARRVVRTTGADYAVVIGPRSLVARGFLPLPGQGPLVTWRSLCRPAPPDRWSWTIGDVELF